ncbi:MAG: D-alanine--D-alanine ligase A [Bacteroidetes bacterium 4572_114]|nr:MAG: D-alanine--D-alanine ligase A [Bacteroidetes bacterium 4572_114]
MRKKVAIIAGGDSGEYTISMNSAAVVQETLDPDKYEPFLIQIKGKDWFYGNPEENISIDKNDFSLRVDGEHIRFDVVFCAIHGSPGENGKLPAYFEMLGIPYTSSDFITLALTFDKNYCNRVVGSWGINVARSLRFFKDDNIQIESIPDTLKFPVFVKPNCGGSSVGMSKVNKPDELEAALSKAFREDGQVLVEEFIDGRELTCGVVELKGKIIVFPICEIVSKKEFFDFEAKYNPSLAMEKLPADIEHSVETEIKGISTLLYKKLNCKGVVRFDYILSNKEQQPYFLEVNTVPGLSRESIIPKMAKEMGIPLGGLFSMMVEDAMVGFGV